nr:hypothetical protein Itr_chr12CG14340 [Ipomoea trifida]
MPPSTLAPSISPSPLRTPSALAPTSGLPPHPPSTPSPAQKNIKCSASFFSVAFGLTHLHPPTSSVSGLRHHQPSPATEQRSSIIGHPLFFAVAMAPPSAKPIAAAFDGSGKSWRRWPSREPPPCDFYSSGSSCNVAPSLLRLGVGSGSSKKQRREQASFSNVLVVAVEALLVDDGNAVSAMEFRRQWLASPVPGLGLLI